MGGAEQPPRSGDGQSVQRSPQLALAARRRAFEIRLVQMVRDMAATAELVAVTAEHLSQDAHDSVARERADRLRSRAEVERQEARRLWDLAQRMEL